MVITIITKITINNGLWWLRITNKIMFLIHEDGGFGTFGKKLRIGKRPGKTGGKPSAAEDGFFVCWGSVAPEPIISTSSETGAVETAHLEMGSLSMGPGFVHTCWEPVLEYLCSFSQQHQVVHISGKPPAGHHLPIPLAISEELWLWSTSELYPSFTSQSLSSELTWNERPTIFATRMVTVILQPTRNQLTHNSRFISSPSMVHPCPHRRQARRHHHHRRQPATAGVTLQEGDDVLDQLTSTASQWGDEQKLG